jgi:signal transduction histidine kinase
MILIIAAVVTAAGVFSTVRVTRELNESLIEQRREKIVAALRELHSADRDSLRHAYERTGSAILVVDDAKNVIARYPPELESFQVKFLPSGALELTRGQAGRSESLVLLVKGNRVDGVGSVYFLPPMQAREREYRPRGDRWLAAGLTAAALLAVVVMLTIFRRVFAPVEALTAGARALAGGRLDARVPVRGQDEVAELGRAFNSMAEGLERNERARRNMVSDVAHELRTPLTNIRVQIEAAQDGVIATDVQLLASIEEEAATLARLVDDLQQLSLAEAGQLRLELAEVAVAELVERAVSGLIGAQDARAQGAGGRGQENEARTPDVSPVPRALPSAPCITDIPPDLIVRADARRMVQVLRNLIVNARMHAVSTIAISAARRENTIEIRVSDDGPGVSPEHAERIFDRFHRVDESRSRTTGGAGLGLAIARQLVELHDGRIWYERPAFVIALPA